jgi:hypothetical protein
MKGNTNTTVNDITSNLNKLHKSSYDKLHERDLEYRAKGRVRNLKCAKQMGIPECFFDRTCDDVTRNKFMIEGKEWDMRNQSDTLANKKYRRAKCWEMCVQPPEMLSHGMPNLQKQLNCSEFKNKIPFYKRLGTGSKLIIGGIIIYILLKK